MAEEDEYDIIPSGIIPGQVGKLLTILALPQEGSFTDPEHEHLVTTINYSSCTLESESATLESTTISVKRRPHLWRRCPLKNVMVCLFLWIAYTLCNVAYSTINPFFPQVVSLRGG